MSARGSQGPSHAQRPAPFCPGRGRLSAPSQALFHTHVFVFPRPRFFFFRGQTRLNGMTKFECCYENSPELADGFLEHVFTEALPGRPRCPWFLYARSGKCCSFFSFVFLCLVRRFLPFLPFFFPGSLFEKFSGANFCFRVSVLFCVFGGFLLRFLLYVLAVRSRKCSEKIS